MTRTDQIQFQRLPADAQRAALWRLALRGLSAEQVAERIGWPVADVRRAMDAEAPTDFPVPPRAAAAAAAAAAGALGRWAP